MNKILILIVLLIVSAAGIFLYINRFQKPVEVSQEVLNKLNENKPTLSQDEDRFLNLLEQNAVSGGPPKDGIPAIDKPQYTTAAEADSWLLPNDVVFGIDYQGFVAAYPQRILVWHEILNDQINRQKVSISYCPLTGTAIGFEASVTKDLDSSFGASGKLVNSNLIMYDRISDSYWPQILGKAINGPAKGRNLQEFPVVWTTWDKWKTKFPETKVLSKNTGFVRNYDVNGDPYGSYLREDKGYYASDRLIFEPINKQSFSSNKDDRLKPKTVVVGIRDKDGNAVAILKDSLRQQKKMEVSLGDKVVVVDYDQSLDFYQASVKDTKEAINAFDAMWFAWVAFYPNTKLIE
ncbi:DUF3179 domain-containing protein [Candidatus Daviesbacteria bacterium]|nr:DUF3179 domain-containing protein [Candidatus Daviesbacteria bacterium]